MLHEDWAWNVTSTVFQVFSFFWPSDLVFDPAWPSFELDRGIIRTNLPTKFHDDLTGNVASRVFTRFLYSQIRKTALPTGGYVFQRTGTTFKLNQHIIKTNILTKLHEDCHEMWLLQCLQGFSFFLPSCIVTLFLTQHDPVLNSNEVHVYHWDKSSDRVSWRSDKKCGL